MSAPQTQAGVIADAIASAVTRAARLHELGGPVRAERAKREFEHATLWMRDLAKLIDPAAPVSVAEALTEFPAGARVVCQNRLPEGSA